MPVHFEKLALYELAKFLTLWNQPDPQFEIFPGGIEVSLPLGVGCELNRVLKIPVRILLRIIEAPTTSDDDFKQLLRQADLKRFSPLGAVHVSSRSSFLRFKKSLEHVVYDELSFKPNKKGADIFIRFFRDICTISVNTSGEDLYLRGYDKWVAEAPVRDNIASGLLQLLLKGIPPEEQIELIDPMAGSGTFLLEAFLLNKSVKRDFSYNQWEIYKKANLSPKEKGGVLLPSSWSLFASDLLNKNKEIVEHNAKAIGATMNVTVDDLFKTAKKSKSQKQRVVVCNPPYGKRLKTSGHTSYFQDILDRISEVYSPERIGLLTPPTWLEHMSYERLHLLDLENSGLQTQFAVFYKKEG